MMMSGRSSTFVSCFALLFHITILLLASLLPFSVSQSPGLVDQICKNTPYYDLCISTLNSSPLGKNPDLKEVATVFVNDILAKASDTQSYIEGLIRSTKDPTVQRALAKCDEGYTDVVKYILPQATNAIVNKGDFKFASYSVSFAMKDVSSCDKTPAEDRNSIVEKLLEVGAAIIKQGI